MTFRLWVNADRTWLMRLWEDGAVEIAAREDAQATWGPPIYLVEEKAS